MSRPFIIVFNSLVGEAALVQSALDSMPEVTHWFRCFPHAIFFTSTKSANELATKLRSKLGVGVPGDKRFVVLQVSSAEAQGWLPPAAWHLIQNPGSPVFPQK